MVTLRHEWSSGDLYLIFTHTLGALAKRSREIAVRRHFKMAATIADAAM